MEKKSYIIPEWTHKKLFNTKNTNENKRKDPRQNFFHFIVQVYFYFYHFSLRHFLYLYLQPQHRSTEKNNTKKRQRHKERKFSEPFSVDPELDKRGKDKVTFLHIEIYSHRPRIILRKSRGYIFRYMSIASHKTPQLQFQTSLS